MADGQFWTVPGPLDLGTHPFNVEEYEALLEAICAAEDDSERFRATLALTIYLLNRNYELTPADYVRLLDFRPGSAAASAGREAMDDLAAKHLRFRPRLMSTGRAAEGPPRPSRSLSRVARWSSLRRIL